MTQHDYVLDNQRFAPARQDLNQLFEAIATLNAGRTPPQVVYPNMLWFDQAAGVLKQRNASNSRWNVLMEYENQNDNRNKAIVAADRVRGVLDKDRLPPSSVQTEINARRLEGRGAAYLRNASNLNAGTINAARLPANNVQTTINAARLQGEDKAYYENADNIKTGTIDDARLPPVPVRLLPQLTAAQAGDSSDTTQGLVSGQRLFTAAAAVGAGPPHALFVRIQPAGDGHRDALRGNEDYRLPFPSTLRSRPNITTVQGSDDQISLPAGQFYVEGLVSLEVGGTSPTETFLWFEKRFAATDKQTVVGVSTFVANGAVLPLAGFVEHTVPTVYSLYTRCKNVDFIIGLPRDGREKPDVTQWLKIWQVA